MNKIENERLSISEIVYKNKGLKNAVIELTNNCLFYCPHCYINRLNKNYLTVFKATKIIDELFDLNCLFLLFTGGEILLHPCFKQIYLYAWHKGFIISLNTNGYLLDKNMVNFLKIYPPKSVEISLYGVDYHSYYQFTKVKDAFRVIDSNLNNLKRANINVILKWVLMKQNIDYFDKLIAYSKSKNCQYRYDYVIFADLNGSSKNCLSTRLEPKTLVDKIFNHDETKTYFTQKVKELKPINDTKVFSCSGGEDNIYIDSYGNIKMCVVDSIEDYNIDRISIKDALKQYQEMKKTIIFNSNNKCKHCYKKSICRYCPNRFYLETNDLEKHIEWYCEVADMIITKVRNEIIKIKDINSKIKNDILKQMYNIIIDNNKKIYHDFKEAESDYDIWKNNILNNKELKTIIALEDDKVVGYLQYMVYDNIYTICEIEINETHQGDKVTFRKLVKHLSLKIKENDIIKCSINPLNHKSMQIFTFIGFKEYENNKYEISYFDFEKWLNKTS